MKQNLYCCIISIFLFSACQNHGKDIQRSFYYWKSVFKLTPKEKAVLDNLSVETLYIKLFDVEWNEDSKQPLPIAQIKFSDKVPLSVTPVIFITNESLQRIAFERLDTLGKNIVNLAHDICTGNHLSLTNELQIDCDWTEQTKDKYFRLLKVIHQQLFAKNKILSATIRLHQLKFISLAGIPPVDKGLLMCYNMGNLRLPQTKNSILDFNEMEKYVGNITDYPLQLDVALPIFDWYVWFRENDFKGLIHNYTLKDSMPKQDRIWFDHDTTISGLAFKKGDWLRYESSNAPDILKAAKLLNRKIISKKINVILYHLDENNIDKFSQNELESIYNSFH